MVEDFTDDVELPDRAELINRIEHSLAYLAADQFGRWTDAELLDLSTGLEDIMVDIEFPSA
jgi:hypothetical protein